MRREVIGGGPADLVPGDWPFARTWRSGLSLKQR